MALFFNPQAGVVEIDSAVYDSWVAVDNPKADYYRPIPDQPSPQHYWDGEQWLSPPPPPPTPDWATFKTVALNSATLNQIQAAAYQTAPVAAGSLAAALLLADGNGWADFAAAWAKICAAVPVAPDVIAGFQQVAAACHLPEAFVEALQPSSPQAAAQPPVT